MTEELGNKPAWTVRYGAIRAAVWRNTIENGEVDGVFYNVTLSRSYRGSDGQWHDTQSFGYDDLLAVAKAADDCHTWIARQVALDWAATKGEPAILDATPAVSDVG